MERREIFSKAVTVGVSSVRVQGWSGFKRPAQRMWIFSSPGADSYGSCFFFPFRRRCREIRVNSGE